MRVTPQNVVLGVVFVLLLGANLLGPRDTGPTREVVRLAPALTPSDAASFDLRGAGRRVLATKVEGAWVLPELFGYPADHAQLERVLTRFADLSTLDLLTEDPARHGEYGLDEASAQRVTVTGADGAPMLDVFLARGSTGSSYVRAVGGDAVYGAGAMPNTSSDVQVWRKLSALIDADPALVTRVELSGEALGAGAAALVVGRDPNRYDRWVDAAGQELRRDLAQSLVRDLTQLYPERVLAAEAAAEHGLTPPWLAVRVTDARGVERSASLARPVDDTPVLAVGSAGPWVGAYHARSVATLLERCRALRP